MMTCEIINHFPISPHLSVEVHVVFSGTPADGQVYDACRLDTISSFTNSHTVATYQPISTALSFHR